MFSKIRYAARVLRSQGRFEMAESDEARHASPRSRRTDDRVNPALRVIEAALAATFSVYVLGRVFERLLGTTPKEASILVTISAIALYSAFGPIHHRIAKTVVGKVRLDKLDPYFGNRLKHAIHVLKGG